MEAHLLSASWDDAGQPVNLSVADLECILNVMGYAWSELTLETYGTALLAWQVYCNSKNIPEHSVPQPAPSLLHLSSPTLLASIPTRPCITMSMAYEPGMYCMEFPG